ncbi:MAG: hypothetical protein MI867_22595 [Pseudomonadales bacterium]|nr:hypothetical protein [Pseudomonadales bacterium]
MLVNPSVQPQSSITAQPAPPQSEVGREAVVRSDLPPVVQPQESSSSQNQRLETDQRFAQDLAEQAVVDDQAAQAQQTNQQSQDSSLEQRLASERATEEQVAEQQRQQDDAIIRQLKSRDREVRVHEAAHAAVGGRYAGSPSFQYERGPDGVNYAVSGEVSISVSKVAGDPEATLEKAKVIRAAALAPAEPSAQDRRVAAEASQLQVEARSDIQAQKIAAEQDRRDRIEASRQEAAEDERVEDEQVSEDVEVNIEEVSVADTTVSVGGDQSAGDGGDDERASGESNEASEKTAKDQLEEILLGNQSVPQALNQAGLVDTQNPYGKSGLIEYIV